MKAINDSQAATLAALASLAGWSTYRDLVRIGGNGASCAALVRNGLLATRGIGENWRGEHMREWRITKQGVSALISSSTGVCALRHMKETDLFALEESAPTGVAWDGQ